MKFKLTLKRRYKVLLYICTILFGALSLYSVILDTFSWLIRIPIYVAAALCLFASCYFIVTDVIYMIYHGIKPRIADHKYAIKLKEDQRLKTVIFTIPGVMSNLWFALLNAAMGILGLSPWFGSLAAYYILLSIMRIQAVGKERYIRQNNFTFKEKMKREIAIYRYNSFCLFCWLLCCSAW